MRAAFFWLIGTIVGNLLSNQVEAWLPVIARRIVRHQAEKMGERAERCLEEWLAHLDETPGALAKLSVALGTLVVPIRVALHNSPGGAPAAVGRWMRDRTAWLMLPLVVLLIVSYPPDRSRYAAYAFLLPLLVGVGLVLLTPVRRRLLDRYERLHHLGRVGVGGMVLPITAYLVLAWTLIAPSHQPPRKAPISTYTSGGPLVFYVPSLPLDADGLQPLDGVSLATPSIADQSPLDTLVSNGLQPFAEAASLLPSIRIPPMPSEELSVPLLEAHTPTDTSASPVYTTLVEASLPQTLDRIDDSSLPNLEASPLLALSEYPPVPLSEQPIPSPQELRLLPTAPTNLRITAPQ